MVDSILNKLDILKEEADEFWKILMEKIDFDLLNKLHSFLKFIYEANDH